MSALWTIDAMAAAMRADKSGALPADVPGLSIDSRTLTKGEAFFAINGDSRDGHDFVEAALKAGAGVAVVARAKRAQFAADAPLLAVDDVLEALRDLARAARARSPAKIVAVTGSVGKTSTKEMLRLALAADGETHASAASYNNHWGVPLSLARLPASARYAVFEIGMNHAGEITPLTKLVRPHVAIVTTIAPVHLEYFGSLRRSPTPRRKSSRASSRAAPPCSIATTVNMRSSSAPPGGRRRAHRVVRRQRQGERAVAALFAADRMLDRRGAHPRPAGHLQARRARPASGAQFAGRARRRRAGRRRSGAGGAGARQSQPASGRGTRVTLRVHGGSALLIDESYNANPASMAAAIALLGQAAVGGQGRRIAVLGDMLELGAQGPALHRALAEPIQAAGVDLVFCGGPLMSALWEALPSGTRGGYAETAAGLEPAVLAAIRAGDAVMVKGSLGSKMGPIVKALERQFARPAALEQAGP